MLDVYHKDNTEFFTIKEFKFNSTHMGEKKINATVYSPDNLDFEIGAYVMYRGEKFSIWNKTPKLKSARTGENIGNAIKYDLEFFAPYKIMEAINFEDYVTSDDTNQYYTGTPVFAFFNNVNELAARIQANLDRFLGAGVWSVNVNSSVILEEKQVSVNNNNLIDGLRFCNDIFGLDYFINGTSITIGGSGLNIDTTFYYGKNKGLYELERVFETEEKVITRLKAYGSGRNLPQYYLRDENAKGRYFTQLMLPNFATTGIDYVDAPAEIISEYGIREGSQTFDDIYPSIEEIDLGSGRIDEIVSVEPIDLESDYFTINVLDLGFDINEYLTAETARVSIKGSNADASPTYLGGYEFEIVEVLNNGSGYTIRLLKNQADNNILPDDVATVRAGDRFVLLGIRMPDSYITNAENKLSLRASETFTDEGSSKISYIPKFDEKFIEINDIGDDFDSGKRVKIEDDDLGVANYFTIQNMTISYGDLLPKYEGKLSNIKAKSLKEEFRKTETSQVNFNSVSNKSSINTRVNNNITVRAVENDITWQ